MRLLLVGAAVLCSLASAAYVPGTPGASWTEEELLVYKGKIRWIMDNHRDALRAVDGGEEIYNLYMSQEHPTNLLRVEAVSPTLAKIVRLTFHDCLREENGAGCNGCINFEGMGSLFSHKRCYHWKRNPEGCTEADGGIHPASGPFVTDNNNLLWVAKVLEAVYRDPSFGPDNLIHLETSLFDSGKSRADLWAYAGLVAIQRGSEKSNAQCRSAQFPAPCLGQVDASSPDCSQDLPEFTFKSGRSDCTPSCQGENDFPFCTSEPEVHPNQHGNGDETVSYFKENFDLTPKESIALLGVHTLGHPNEFNSMFRHYPWTRNKENFNNVYYTNIVNTTLYRYMNPKRLPEMKGHNVNKCGLPISAFNGDEYGNPREVAFKVRSEGRTNANGPWNWNVFGGKCNLDLCQEILEAEGEYSINSCCYYAEHCFPMTDSCPSGNFACTDEDDCESKNVFQRINMLSPDMGLYYKFDVDEEGRPTGCPGLDDPAWLQNKNHFSGEVQCEMNDAPATETQTMSDVVQMYAEDNQLWMQDFADVFEKMLENGVDLDDLKEESSAWFTARCNGKHQCK